MSKASVVFVDTPEQVNFLEMHRPELMKGCWLVSLGLDTSVRLRELRANYVDYWQCIDIGRFHELQEEAYYLRDNWYADPTVYGSEYAYPIAHYDRYDWTYAFRDMLVARELYRSVVDKNTTRIYVFSQDVVPAPTTWSPGYDVPAAVWRYMAECAQIRVDTIPKIGTVQPLCDPRRIVRGAKRRFLRYAGRQFGVRHRPKTWPAIRPGSILYVVASGEWYRQGPTCSSLQAVYGKLLVRLTSEGSDSVGDPMFRSIGEMLPSASRQQRLAWESRPWNDFPLASSYPEFFRNRHLDFQFSYFFDKKWPDDLRLAEWLEQTLLRNRPRAIVTTDAPFGCQAIFVGVAEHLQIPALTVPHSVMPYVDRILLTGDRAIVWTEDYRQAYLKEGLEDAAISAIGVPETMLFRGHWRAHGRLRPFPMNKRKTVLVLSQGLSCGLLPHLDLGSYRETADVLIGIPYEIRDRISLIWRCHPSDQRHYDLMMAIVGMSGKCGNVAVTAKGSLEDSVEQADVVVVTSPTSAYLAPIFLKKPLVYLDTCQHLRQTFHLVGRRSPCVVCNISDIWPTLHGALFDHDIRATILRDNRAIRDGLCARSDLISAADVASAITQAIESTSVSTFQGQVR